MLSARLTSLENRLNLYWKRENRFTIDGGKLFSILLDKLNMDDTMYAMNLNDMITIVEGTSIDVKYARGKFRRMRNCLLMLIKLEWPVSSFSHKKVNSMLLIHEFFSDNPKRIENVQHEVREIDFDEITGEEIAHRLSLPKSVLNQS